MNYITVKELEEILQILQTLQEIEASHVYIGAFEVHDSNGERLGCIKYADGNYVFAAAA